MAAPKPRVVLEPRALRMSVEGRVLPLTAIEYTIRSRLESNLPSKSSNLRSIPRVSDRLDVSVGIVSQPSGDTGHYFNVTDASTNRYSSANASVNIKLHVWYDLPSLRKEALISVTMNFQDAGGKSFANTYEVRVAP